MAERSQQPPTAKYIPPGIKWAPFPDGRARWQVYSRATGVKQYVGTASTLAEAIRVQHQHELSAEVDRRDGAEPRPGKGGRKHILGNEVTKWLAGLESDPKFEAAKCYRLVYQRYLAPKRYDEDGEIIWQGADTVLGKLTAPTVTRLLDALLASGGRKGRRLAPATVRLAKGVLSALLSWCRRRGIVASNPCRDVDAIKVPERPQTIIETKPQIKDFLAVCEEGDFRDMILLYLGSALRRSEGIYARWEDLRLNHATPDGKPIPFLRCHGKGPRGGKIRDVPVLDVVLAMLLRRFKARRPGDVLVFPCRNPSPTRKPSTSHSFERRRPLPPGAIPYSGNPTYRKFKAAIARYNERHPTARIAPNIRLHDLRHTFGSHWVNEGGNVHRLSELMGHSNVAITTAIYAKLHVNAYAGDLGYMQFETPDSRLLTPAKKTPRKRARG